MMNFPIVFTTMLLSLHMVAFASDDQMLSVRRTSTEREVLSCENWQFIQSGKCQTCPTGKVANNDKSGCVYCPAGTVRGADGNALTKCEAAACPCSGESQYAQNGKCQTCPTGQVGKEDKTGCTNAATGQCPGAWEYVNLGKCVTCPNGQVAKKDKTGCVQCPTGTVRGIDGKALTACKPAKCLCTDAWKYAYLGSCVLCPNGQVSIEDKAQCVRCPIGTVRGIDGKSLSSCTPAKDICPGAWQVADFFSGRCVSCSTGQVAFADKAQCVFCSHGTVRGIDGKALTTCTAAKDLCTGAWQYAYLGKCVSCPDGQVAFADKAQCVYCPIGTVRGIDGKALTTCTPAKDLCPGVSEYAYLGKCVSCPTGTVANGAKSGCM